MSKHRLKPVEKQVIVITGATSGIGLATARLAVSRGAAVVLAARNAEALGQLGEELRRAGGRAETVVADVSDMAQVEAISVAAIQAFGGFDSWCNNAAVAAYGEIEDVPLEDQRRIFDVNYWGVVHGTLVAARHLKERGGAIVTTGSVLSDRAMALQGTYSAAKFAVKGVTEAFRTEFEAEGYPISLTLVKPGPIDTPYTEHARNLMGTPGTRNPSPSYHPRVVAKAILHACETRVRDLTVGGAGALISILGHWAPKLTDMMMSKTAKETQSSEDPGRAERRDNLYEPKEDLSETSSLDGPEPRKRSFLLEAQMNPLGTAGLLIGAAALLTGAAIGMATMRRRPRTLSQRALSFGHDAYDEARHGIGRLGQSAMGYAHRAEKDAKPTLRKLRKEADRFAERARRYAASLHDEAVNRGEDLYDSARGQGRKLAKEARHRGADAYDDARDRGWSLFGRARDRGEEAYDEARDRGWSLFGRARDQGEEVYEAARKRGRHAAKEGEGLFDRINAALKARL